MPIARSAVCSFRIVVLSPSWRFIPTAALLRWQQSVGRDAPGCKPSLVPRALPLVFLSKFLAAQQSCRARLSHGPSKRCPPSEVFHPGVASPRVVRYFFGRSKAPIVDQRAKGEGETH